MEHATTRLCVDLGTTWTSAAVERDGSIESVHLGDRGASVPSVVAVSDDGSLVAGFEAERAMAAAPERGVREVKRRFGDTTPVVLGGVAHLPDALVAALLATIAAQAGVDPTTTEIVLTHPANWGDYKLELLRDVAARVGFTRCQLVSEPAAAARHFAAAGRLAVGESVVVYDFGGGTFDAAVVRLGAAGPEIVGPPQGIERLGGIDIDQAVFGHVVAALGGAIDGLDRSDPEVRRALVRLRTSCTAAKEQLSADSEATVTVTAPGLSTQVRMTRGELEQAVRPRVAETIRTIERAVGAAGLQLDDLSGVVLVGGTSRLPLVGEMVAAETRLPLVHDSDPKLVVVLGALVAAAAGSTSSPGAGAVAAPPKTHPSDTTPQEGTVSEQESTQPTAAERTSIEPPPEKKKDAGVVSPGIVAGVAAAGAAAVAGGIVYGDEIADAVSDAIGLGGDDAETAVVDESMDAFDEVVEDTLEQPAAGASSAPASAGGGFAPPSAAPAGGGAPTAPPPPPPPPSPSSSAPPPPAPPAASTDAPDVAAAGAAGVDTDFEAAREALLERIGSLELGGDVLEDDLDALRDELRGVVGRFRPDEGESTEEALARLRDAYEERVRDFTQDQKIDALIEEQIRERQADEVDEATDATIDPSTVAPAPDEPAVTAEATDDAEATDEAEATDAEATDEADAAEVDAAEATAEVTEAPADGPAVMLDDSFDDLIVDASELIDKIDPDDLVVARPELPEIDTDVLGDLRLPEPGLDLPPIVELIPDVLPGVDPDPALLGQMAGSLIDDGAANMLGNIAASTELPVDALPAIGQLAELEDLDLPSIVDVDVDVEADLDIEVPGLDDLGL